jgi:hypothetical protein
MNRFLLFLIVLITAAMLTGCPFTPEEDDNDPEEPTLYTGGEIAGVTFEVLGPNSVRIRWSENFPDEEGFVIDRKEWDGEWTYNLLTTSANDTTVVDDTAALDKIYYYHVYAFKGNAHSVKDQIQYNFNLPYPANIDYDYSWSNPNRIRMFWSNLAPWADSIVVAKRLDYGTWTPGYAILSGAAEGYTDTAYNVQTTTSYGYTAYYQDHQSQQYVITFQPPKAIVAKAVTRR